MTKITIFDIAKDSGVSYSTVSRVLNGFEFVKESTRQRVLDSANRLGYVANLSARSLAGGRSNIIGIVVPGLDNGYIGEIVRGVDEELNRASYDIMLYTTHRHQGRESAYIQQIANGLTEGVLIVVPLATTEYAEALREQNFPYVLIDQADALDRSWIVDCTNFQGAYEATEYLIQLGHQRIGFITGLMQIASASERLEGYKAALRDNNLPCDETLIVQGDYLQSSGYQAAQTLLALPQRPTAIFASNDLEALGAMQAIREHGLSIPDDISLMGFDDIPQASMTHPTLTTVRQPLDTMGRVAARLLLEHIENPQKQPRRVTMATKLIVRDSCKSILIHQNNAERR